MMEEKKELIEQQTMESKFTEESPNETIKWDQKIGGRGSEEL